MNSPTHLPRGSMRIDTGVPGIEKTVLSNGMRIVSEFIPDAQSFALGIWISVGTRHEAPAQAGIAHMIEHMVFRRTSTRSSGRIASAFESRGAYVNAFTSKEQTSYYVRALTPHFGLCLSVLADVVLNPVFDERDMEKERSVILEELKSYEDEAEECILDMAERLLFGDHQLGSPIAGTVSSVSKLQTKHVRSFHKKHYRAANITVTIASGLRHDEIVSKVVEVFASTNPTVFGKRLQQVPAAFAAEHVRSSDYTPAAVGPRTAKHVRPFQQSHVCYARRTPGLTHAHRWALSLMNTIIGDGMSSRLHQRVREKMGGTYSLYSSLQLLTDCGVLSVYAGMEQAAATRICEAIEKELNGLALNGVTASELRRAKEQLKSATIMSLESLSSRMNALAKAELEEGYFESIGSTLHAIDAVSMDDMTGVARRLGASGRWTRVSIQGSEAHES